MPKFLKLLSLAAGLLWLTLGFYAATSPKIAPKILALNYGYIAAWLIVYGLPSMLLFWLALRKPKAPCETVTEKAEEYAPSKPEKSFYEESYPELSQEEAELQEIQEVEEDMESENEVNAAEISHGELNLPRIVDQVTIQEVYTIGQKELETEIEAQEPAAETIQTFTCRICDKRISESEYSMYDGMCRLCWIKEKRRSGLFGADRASTW